MRLPRGLEQGVVSRSAGRPGPSVSSAPVAVAETLPLRRTSAMHGPGCATMRPHPPSAPRAPRSSRPLGHPPSWQNCAGRAAASMSRPSAPWFVLSELRAASTRLRRSVPLQFCIRRRASLPGHQRGEFRPDVAAAPTSSFLTEQYAIQKVVPLHIWSPSWHLRCTVCNVVHCPGRVRVAKVCAVLLTI